MRSNDQPLDFDLELAKKQSNDNPVYYVQYAHARIASVLKQAAERGLPFDQAAGLEALASLGEAAELALMREISRWPEVVRLGAEQARRTSSCTTCASSRRPSMPATPRCNSSWTTRKSGTAGSRCIAAARQVIAERARDPRRLGARDDVMVARETTSAAAAAGGVLRLDRHLHGPGRGPCGRLRVLSLRPARCRGTESPGRKRTLAATPPRRARPPRGAAGALRLLPDAAELRGGRAREGSRRSARCAEAAESKGAYVLQAGSYKKFEDADRVRSQLALQGIESNVQRGRDRQRHLGHRVRIGPISDPAELNRVRQRLKEAEVDFLVFVWATDRRKRSSPFSRRTEGKRRTPFSSGL
jgi:cell division septation protein DedD